MHLGYAKLLLSLQEHPDNTRADIIRRFHEAGRRMDLLAGVLGISRATLYRMKNADPVLAKALSDVARPSRRKERSRAKPEQRSKVTKPRRTGT